MCGVLGIGNGRGKNICTCICGVVSTILVVTGETVAKGYKAREDRASRW